jgi:hypothetical protein
MSFSGGICIVPVARLDRTAIMRAQAMAPELSTPTDRLCGFDDIKLDHSTVLDFFLWCHSILSNDPTNGEFAEWMVGKHLGLAMKPGGRIEGAYWDSLTAEGIKIEVKAAAYWQAWWGHLSRET